MSTVFTDFISLTNFGLFISALGTILVAVSFGKYPRGNAPYTHTIDEPTGKKSKKNYIAHFNHPTIFFIGLTLVFLGTVLQIRPTPVIQPTPVIKNPVLENLTNYDDLRSKCAAQSEMTLSAFKAENTGLPFHNFSQSNYYNQQMEKCFEYITYKGPVYNGNTGSYWTLKDAFENKDLAACLYNLNAAPPGAYCFITGGPAALSQDEIDNFIKQRMDGLPTPQP